MALKQEEVRQRFLPLLHNSRRPNVWARMERVFARQLVEDEQITVNDGQVQKKQLCRKDEWVVLSQAGELYKLGDKQFRDRYDHGNPQLVPEESLRSEGFSMFRPKGKLYARFLSRDDVAEFPNQAFEPPWGGGELAFVAVGGALVSPAMRAKKNPNAEVYFIPKHEFKSAYALEDQANRRGTSRWLRSAAFRKSRATIGRSNQTDGFSTQMKAALPEGDQVSEACVRPAMGDEPSYLVVTTRPGLHMLVFELDTFALVLHMPLARIRATNFAPFCSFHRGDYSVLHVAYQVVSWADLAERFNKEGANLPRVKVVDTTMSRFAVFTPNRRIVWKQEGEMVWKHEGRPKLRKMEHPGAPPEIDPHMVASTTREEVFVVMTEQQKRELCVVEFGGPDGETRVARRRSLDNGRLVPFVVHPKWLFVVRSTSGLVRISVLSQDNLDDEVSRVTLGHGPPSVMLSPHSEAAHAECAHPPTLAASAREVFHVTGPNVALRLGALPHGLSVAAVHADGVVVDDGHGRLLNRRAEIGQEGSRWRNRSSFGRHVPMQEIHEDRTSKVFVCSDPRSLTLVVAHKAKLLVFRECRMGNFGDPRVEIDTAASKVRAMCVDWGNEDGQHQRAFLAHDDCVEVIDLTPQRPHQSRQTVKLGGVTELCVVRGASGGKNQRGTLFACCARDSNTVHRFDLHTLQPESPPTVAPDVGNVLRIIPVGDCAMVVGQDPHVDGGGGRVANVRCVPLGRAEGKELVKSRVGPHTLGTTNRRLVGASSVQPNTLEVYNRHGLSISSHFANGEVVHVSSGQLGDCVVFVTKCNGMDDKPRWIVCLLKVSNFSNDDANNNNDGDGGAKSDSDSDSDSNEGKGNSAAGTEHRFEAKEFPVGTQWQLASFGREVLACHVLDGAVAVHCDDCVCVIDMRPRETFPLTNQLFERPPPPGVLDDPRVVRGVASGQEVFWSRLLRRPAVLGMALTQSRLRLLPVVPMSSLLGMVLDNCAEPLQAGLIEVVLDAYVTHLQRHNDRRRGLKDAQEGWDVDFQTMDQRFLQSLLRIVEKFPAQAAKFLREVPLVRLRERDEGRVFGKGVPASKETRAQRELVVGSGDELQDVDWGGEAGQLPRTVGDYVVPFPSHTPAGDDLLVRIAHADFADGTERADFVDGIAVKTIITHRWGTYASGMHFLRLLKFVAALGLTIAVSFLSPSTTSRRHVLGVFAALSVLVLVSLARGVQEFAYARQRTLKYLKNPFRALELVRLLLLPMCMAAFIVAADWGGARGRGWEKWFRVLAGVLVFIHWLGLLRLLQPYRAFGPPIRMMTQIAWDVKYFLIVIGIVVLAISNALYTVLLPDEKVDGYSNFSLAVYTSFKSTVLGGISNMDGLEVEGEARQWLVRVLALVSSLVVTVVLMKLLVATMGDSYGHIQARAEVEFQILRAEMAVVQQAHYEPQLAVLRFALGSLVVDDGDDSDDEDNDSKDKDKDTGINGNGKEEGQEEQKRRREWAEEGRAGDAPAPSSTVPNEEAAARASFSRSHRHLRRPAAWWFKRACAPLVFLLRRVTWLYAYPMHRMLNASGKRPDALYDDWLHVLVSHNQTMNELNMSGQWLGALHHLQTQLTNLGAQVSGFKAEMAQQQEKRLAAMEERLGGARESEAAQQQERRLQAIEDKLARVLELLDKKNE